MEKYMEVKEKNFFKKVWTSIRDFEGYEEFAAEKVSKAITYLILMTLICALVITIINTYNFTSEIGKARNYINENIEEISIIDRKT